MNDTSREILNDGPVAKVVLKNVIPSIISMLMVLVYNLADTFFIGQTNNSLMVAAVSLGTPLFLLFIAVGMLFGIGGTSLISRRIGEGNQEQARSISAFCYWTGAVVGIVSMALIWAFLEPLCRLVGATPDTFVYVKEYISIVSISIPFLIISNSFSNIIRAEGKANVAMFGMIAGNLINIVLDPVLILGFHLNVKGAAIATFLGNIGAALFYTIYICKTNSLLSVNPKDFKAGNAIAKNVFAIGIPASLNSLLISISNIVVNNFMTRFGDMAVAGLGVSMKVNMIVIMLLVGLGTGIQPVLGVCFGAGNRKRFTQVLRFSLFLAFGMSVVMTAICYICAGPMVKAFLEDSAACGFGMQFARILILSGPVLGILFVLTNAIQAMGAATQALILSVSRQGILYIPTLILFNIVFHNAAMLTAAQPVADYLSTLLSVALYITACRKHFAGRKQKEAAVCRM